MKRLAVITAVLLMTAACSSSSASRTSEPSKSTAEPSAERDDAKQSPESTVTTAATTTTEATTTTAPQQPLTPELVAHALSDQGMCLNPEPFERDPSDFTSMGLEAPTSEWQCRSSAGLIIIQAFPSIDALHDAAVAVSGAMAAHGDDPRTAPVLDLGDGLVLDANNGSDTSITPDLEMAWLEQAQAVVGGTIVNMTEI